MLVGKQQKHFASASHNLPDVETAIKTTLIRNI